MSEYFKDVMALVIGTVLVMLTWLAIGGGTFRLSPDTATQQWVPEASEAQPVAATGAVTVGLER